MPRTRPPCSPNTATPTLDGTGLGTDKSIWGGELLFMELDAPRWQRLGRLAPFRLPGGEAAIREPWRIALGLALQSGLAPEALTGIWADCADDGDDVRRAPQAMAVTAVSEMWPVRCRIRRAGPVYAHHL